MQPQGLEVSVFLIVANIIIVIAAVFFFLIIRIQQKRKRLYEKQLLEKEYKTREEAFLQISRDLHDEIGSSLSGINLFAQMAAKQL
ncbi:MAG: histidine kinase dimerization/phosphoacceptor domain-containing protein, partial [Chitinophagaceae bacterium]|nr:histidine kinase dimerization/phosphoacceptor domain-containing protein [Chitinophagaceae bacterium]